MRLPGVQYYADSSLVRQNCRLIDNNRLLCGDLEVQSFSIPHDAADPHGYTFTSRSNSSKKCTYLTDAGFVTDTIREAVAGSSALVLEANHDVEMLKNGPYPHASARAAHFEYAGTFIQ